MIKKYNLALVPTTQASAVIQTAHQLTHLADSYLLGLHSLPHVTLYQFRWEENQIDALWDKTCRLWKEPHLTLTFKEVSRTTYDRRLHWIALLPNQTETLHRMHALVAEILDLPIKKSFDPHMTLLNTKHADCQKEVDRLVQVYTPISDSFILTLGESDEVGQFLKVLNSTTG